MDRLTERLPGGRIMTRGRVYSEIHMDLVRNERVNDRYDIRLAEYEDTGLMPEEITRLQAQCAAMRKALGHIRKQQELARGSAAAVLKATTAGKALLDRLAKAEAEAKEWQDTAIIEQKNYGEACSEIIDLEQRLQKSEAVVEAARDVCEELMGHGLFAIATLQKALDDMEGGGV